MVGVSILNMSKSTCQIASLQRKFDMLQFEAKVGDAIINFDWRFQN